ncbi:hypothetical protein BU25DRAFT_444874 [Macroventuria anomochaeta]|uniref:Uncharacterized protein n=1 Tax=Macroventuria anomochaeta TaxID=301207 RepID=A0ACB6SHA0_9PLEO|nr:uncharacterized protein BU25DRAFT_444874 [Macroventuria anomochaeta]KAF2632862.1 hypothetical protein BU25DRAFT_444874 [Macroventuria anomochaeta]
MESFTPLNHPEDAICSICKEVCVANDFAPVLKVLACPKFYFHSECIVAWFKSTDQQRGTCPNDRRGLLEPDPIVRPPPGEVRRLIGLGSAPLRLSEEINRIDPCIATTMENMRVLERQLKSLATQGTPIISVWESELRHTIESNLRIILGPWCTPSPNCDSWKIGMLPLLHQFLSPGTSNWQYGYKSSSSVYGSLRRCPS